MSHFDQWFSQADNRFQKLPESTRDQIKDLARYAFYAGMNAEKDARKADKKAAGK